MKKVTTDNLDTTIEDSLNSDQLTKNSSVVVKKDCIPINRSIVIYQYHIDHLMKLTSKKISKTKKSSSLSEIIREILDSHIKGNFK